MEFLKIKINFQHQKMKKQEDDMWPSGLHAKNGQA